MLFGPAVVGVRHGQALTGRRFSFERLIRKVFLMKKFLLIIVTNASLLVAAAPGFASGVNPETELSKTSSQFVGAIKSLTDSLDRKPDPVEVGKWRSIGEGATEIKAKVIRLKVAIDAAEATAGELGVTNGKLQARLDGLIGEFNKLADEAGGQADGLEEPLASVVKRERQVWMHWAEVAGEFKVRYGETLLRFQKQASNLKHVRPMLVRLDRGANVVVELASVGERLDQQMKTLESLADELNGIISAFGALADDARNAIASLGVKEPTNTQVSSIPAAPPLAVASGTRESIRIWRTSDGHVVQARLVGFDGNMASFDVDGHVYPCAVDRLIPSDQTHVRRLMVASAPVSPRI